SDTHVVTMWDFREDRRGESQNLFVVDQFTYREDHRTAVSALDAEQQERTQVAPASFFPGPFTYREDHRGEIAVVAASDPFLYREDRRGEAVAVQPVGTVSTEQFTYREDHRGEVVTPVWYPDFWTYREDRRDH